MYAFEYDLILTTEDGKEVEGIFYCNEELEDGLGYVVDSNLDSSMIINASSAVGMPKIKKIIVYNDKATVIFWKDDSEPTKVVLGDLDEPDLEKAVAIAIAKKYYGSYTNMTRSLSRVKYVFNK